MGRVLYWWTQMFLLLFQVFLISQAHLGSSLPVEEDRGVYEWIFGEETTTSITTKTTTTSTTTTPPTTATTTTATTTTTTPEPSNLIDVIQDFIWNHNHYNHHNNDHNHHDNNNHYYNNHNYSGSNSDRENQGDARAVDIWMNLNKAETEMF